MHPGSNLFIYNHTGSLSRRIENFNIRIFRNRSSLCLGIHKGSHKDRHICFRIPNQIEEGAVQDYFFEFFRCHGISCRNFRHRCRTCTGTLFSNADKGLVEHTIDKNRIACISGKRGKVRQGRIKGIAHTHSAQYFSHFRIKFRLEFGHRRQYLTFPTVA